MDKGSCILNIEALEERVYDSSGNNTKSKRFYDEFGNQVKSK